MGALLFFVLIGFIFALCGVGRPTGRVGRLRRGGLRGLFRGNLRRLGAPYFLGKTVARVRLLQQTRTDISSAKPTLSTCGRTYAGPAYHIRWLPARVQPRETTEKYPVSRTSCESEPSMVRSSAQPFDLIPGLQRLLRQANDGRCRGEGSQWTALPCSSLRLRYFGNCQFLQVAGSKMEWHTTSTQ